MGLKALLHGCIKQYGETDYKTVLVSQKLDPYVNKKQREMMK